MDVKALVKQVVENQLAQRDRRVAEEVTAMYQRAQSGHPIPGDRLKSVVNLLASARVRQWAAEGRTTASEDGLMRLIDQHAAEIESVEYPDRVKP